ncbi:hypothetical protein GQ457_06G017760 [Hibiscus cannabinus]
MSILTILGSRDGVALSRYRRYYRPLDIRPKRTVDFEFLMSDVYNFDLFDLFATWGWLDFLNISNTYYPLLIRAFYANGVYLGGPHNEGDPHNILAFRDGNPTHLDIEERLFLLITTWFFRPSGGRATRMRKCDYWWLRCYRDRTRPNIAQIIFTTLVKIIHHPPPFSLPYGCVLSHIFRILGIDTSLDRAAQWFFDERVGWIHGGEKEDDDDEAPIGDVPIEEISAPLHEDVPIEHAPAPMTMEFMYQTMMSRFDHMTTCFDSLDARMTSIEEDIVLPFIELPIDCTVHPNTVVHLSGVFLNLILVVVLRKSYASFRCGHHWMSASILELLDERSQHHMSDHFLDGVATFASRGRGYPTLTPLRVTSEHPNSHGRQSNPRLRMYHQQGLDAGGDPVTNRVWESKFHQRG